MERVKLHRKALDLTRKEDVEMNNEAKGGGVLRNIVSVEDLLKTGNPRLTGRLQNSIAGRELNLEGIASSRIRNDQLIDFDIPVRVRVPQITRRVAKVSERKYRLARSKDILVAGAEIISGLNKHGIDAKPFCIHIPKAKEKSFIVHGKDFKWVVLSLKSYEEILGMPKKEWNTLVKFEKAGIKHDGIFVAAPFKGNAKERAMKEVKEMCRDAVMKIGAILTMPFHIAASVADALLKDPVLLVRFSGFKKRSLYIEIGRWD